MFNKYWFSRSVDCADYKHRSGQINSRNVLTTPLGDGPYRWSPVWQWYNNDTVHEATQTKHLETVPTGDHPCDNDTTMTLYTKPHKLNPAEWKKTLHDVVSTCFSTCSTLWTH